MEEKEWYKRLCLYDASGNPVATMNYKTVNKLFKYRNVYKKDKIGRITLNLSEVRKLNGRCTIKQLYKHNKQINTIETT